MSASIHPLQSATAGYHLLLVLRTGTLQSSSPAQGYGQDRSFTRRTATQLEKTLDDPSSFLSSFTCSSADPGRWRCTGLCCFLQRGNSPGVVCIWVVCLALPGMIEWSTGCICPSMQTTLLSLLVTFFFTSILQHPCPFLFLVLFRTCIPPVQPCPYPEPTLIPKWEAAWNGYVCSWISGCAWIL